jgi:hypothetical protein
MKPVELTAEAELDAFADESKAVVVAAVVHFIGGRLGGSANESLAREAMKRRSITPAKMARLMKTSRPVVYRMVHAAAGRYRVVTFRALRSPPVPKPACPDRALGPLGAPRGDGAQIEVVGPANSEALHKMAKRKQGRRRARRLAARASAAARANGAAWCNDRARANRPAHAGDPKRRCGRYELLHPLGVGGMAEVFKARVSGAAGFRRDVVLKRLHAANDDDPEFVNMFKDEARILGMLHHPNIVEALDFGEADDKLFLVLEHVEGPSLARVLRDRRGVSPSIVAYLGREICRALDYMHRFEDADGEGLGLVHRDVTPSNIVVTPTGTVKLLDFGIAKFVNAAQSTLAGHVKGKSGYLAPEQLRGEGPIDGRVDLFALGTVLHELLTGERLFAAESDLGTMKRILDMKIPTPSSKLAWVPPALDRIVMRALERDPDKRYATAAAMARDLDEVVLEAHLRVDDVVAFVRDVEDAPAGKTFSRMAPASVGDVTAEACKAPTRRDLLLPLRWWVGALPSGRRAALVAGLSLMLVVAGALGWGVTSLTSAGARQHGRVTSEHHVPDHQAPARATPGPSGPIAQTIATDR